MCPPSKISVSLGRPRSRREERKQSIDERIVAAALRQIMKAGAGKLALAEVAVAADVSRTTLYKYYRTRDALLSAVSRRVRHIYQAELRSAIRGHDAPDDRLLAVLKFMDDFHEKFKAEQLINLQIKQIVGDIRRSFSLYCALIDEALAPTFEAMERRGLNAVGRKLCVELLIRVQLSNAIVPLDPQWRLLPGLLRSAWYDLLNANMTRKSR